MRGIVLALALRISLLKACDVPVRPAQPCVLGGPFRSPSLYQVEATDVPPSRTPRHEFDAIA